MVVVVVVVSVVVVAVVKDVVEVVLVLVCVVEVDVIGVPAVLRRVWMSGSADKWGVRPSSNPLDQEWLQWWYLRTRGKCILRRRKTIHIHTFKVLKKE